MTDKVNLRGIEALLEEERKATEHIRIAEANLKKWQAYRQTRRNAITTYLAGQDRGYLDGNEVVTYEPKDQYGEQRFRKERPDLAKEFTIERMVETIDWDALRAAMPDVVNEYQVRTFVNRYLPPPPPV